MVSVKVAAIVCGIVVLVIIIHKYQCSHTAAVGVHFKNWIKFATCRNFNEIRPKKHKQKNHREKAMPPKTRSKINNNKNNNNNNQSNNDNSAAVAAAAAMQAKQDFSNELERVKKLVRFFIYYCPLYSRGYRATVLLPKHLKTNFKNFFSQQFFLFHLHQNTITLKT